MSIIEDILEKIPEEYDIAEMMTKTMDRSPYTLVCFQECERMNFLLAEIRRSLSELHLGLMVQFTLCNNSIYVVVYINNNICLFYRENSPFPPVWRLYSLHYSVILSQIPGLDWLIPLLKH